jgi:hypothetical protein
VSQVLTLGADFLPQMEILCLLHLYRGLPNSKFLS